MPGRRLTSTDRRRIAEGLARGLDYADIARRLGRPTSTVSREVARNGGPGRYRADLAQLATTHRARRRPHPPATQALGEQTGPDPAATAAFVAELTAVLIETGLPRTAAGVMACLFISETGSHTAAELAQHLRVSAATISHAVGLLHQHGLIRRDRDSRSRRHRYFLDENAGLRSAVVGVRANQRFATTALRGADIFGTDTAVGTRLATAGRFLEQLGNDILRAAEQHWRTTAGAGPRDVRTTPATTTLG
ncbi:MarR family transcriptional regulator [Amycolatopsis anabasis]|uniref:MarR family transcriptional regulator n=1 Tax=Amycolatopsis anabasis TaxID=1840409 RepID=UPI00131BA098|nr:helix-turn-helix domain-containing protein [Amycolatopsis anabasis]